MSTGINYLLYEIKYYQFQRHFQLAYDAQPRINLQESNFLNIKNTNYYASTLCTLVILCYLRYRRNEHMCNVENVMFI